MKRPDIDAIKARTETATPGPWGICLGSGGNLCTALSSQGFEDWDLKFTPIADFLPDWILNAEEKDGGSIRKDHRPDMVFVAHARQDIPDLIAYIEHLEARLEAKEPTCKPSLQVPQPEPDYTSETEDLSTWPQTRGKEWRRMGYGETIQKGDVGYYPAMPGAKYADGWIGFAIGEQFSPSEAWTRRPPQTKGEG